MPELPEVQTVVDFLKDLLPEKTILSVQSPNGYTGVLENGSLKSYQDFLCNRKIETIYRRGKFIIVKLDSGFLLFHLRMTGRIVLEIPDKSEFKYVSFQLIFSDGTNLFFRDTRKFGRVYICQNLDWLETRLGIEPLSDDLTASWLHQQLKQRQRMMKPLLMDQRFIAGLGNIYVDELKSEIKNSSSILIASPIYNYDLNAAAKNLIELTGKSWKDKLVGFISAAGGQGSYMSPMSYANSLMLDFRCIIIPRFVYADTSCFNNGKISDDIQERIKALVDASKLLSKAIHY